MNNQFSILYEDRELAVLIKAPGVLSQKDASRDPDLLSLLSLHYAEKRESREVFAVHRLDRGVGGVMVVARSKRMAAQLSAEIADHDAFSKCYLAVVHGALPQPSASLVDYLYHDERARRTQRADKDDPRGKRAELSFRVLSERDVSESKRLSLVLVRLHTGRTHQIRAQFSFCGHPLAGDRRYGAKDRYGEIALFSCALSFVHPTTKKRLTFRALPGESSAFREFSLSDEIFERSMPD